MIMIKRMSTTTPMIIIIFMFCHQYFLFNLVACNHTENIGIFNLEADIYYLSLKLVGPSLEIVCSRVEL